MKERGRPARRRRQGAARRTFRRESKSFPPDATVGESESFDPGRRRRLSSRRPSRARRAGSCATRDQSAIPERRASTRMRRKERPRHAHHVEAGAGACARLSVLARRPSMPREWPLAARSPPGEKARRGAASPRPLRRASHPRLAGGGLGERRDFPVQGKSVSGSSQRVACDGHPPLPAREAPWGKLREQAHPWA